VIYVKGQKKRYKYILEAPKTSSQAWHQLWR
jgi:hypothetical protein